jgi:hypothetical protein
MNMTGISPERVGNLAAPFPPESVHWRGVQDRLDGVCGPENWSDSYVETPKGRIICSIAVNIEGAWISKSDGAGDTDVEGEKGALSDAMKRAAVKWGIGRYLYSMPSPWVPCEVTQNGKFRRFKEDPWKYVRGHKAPEPTALPMGVQKMLDEITACETQMVLQRWWKTNATKIPDAHHERVVGAVNARKEAIETMDRSAA